MYSRTDTLYIAIIVLKYSYNFNLTIQCDLRVSDLSLTLGKRVQFEYNDKSLYTIKKST